MAPPLNLNDPNHVTALIVISVEIILFALLLLARYNIRRLRIHNHHKYVYTVVLLNSTIILLWMIPVELRLVNRVLDGRTDALAVWYVLLHGLFGLIAIILGITLCLIFLLRVIKQELIPLTLIKKMKPLMITTFIFWTLAILFGILIFLNKYIVRFL